MRKLDFGVFDQVRLKTGCTTTDYYGFRKKGDCIINMYVADHQSDSAFVSAYYAKKLNRFSRDATYIISSLIMDSTDSCKFEIVNQSSLFFQTIERY